MRGRLLREKRKVFKVRERGSDATIEDGNATREDGNATIEDGNATIEDGNATREEQVL